MVWKPTKPQKTLAKALGSVDYGLVAAAVASGISLREPFNIRHLSSSDTPGRSWKLTSSERAIYVGGSPIDPRNIRLLTSGDKPSRSWKLTSGEIYKPVRQALMDREPYNIRKLTSGDKPSRSWKLTSSERAIYVGGSPIDPRNIRLLTSGDIVRIKRDFNEGILASGVAWSPGTFLGTIVVNGARFTVAFKRIAGATSMIVGHYYQVRKSGAWYKQGEDTLSGDLVITPDHKVYAYKPKAESASTSMKVTVEYRIEK